MDKLDGRRKKATGPNPRPGTPEFGQRARQRGVRSAAEIREERERGDLRVRTARWRMKGLKNRTNRYLGGD